MPLLARLRVVWTVLCARTESARAQHDTRAELVALEERVGDRLADLRAAIGAVGSASARVDTDHEQRLTRLERRIDNRTADHGPW